MVNMLKSLAADCCSVAVSWVCIIVCAGSASGQGEKEYLIAAISPLSCFEDGANSTEEFLDECTSFHDGIKLLGTKSSIQKLIDRIGDGLDLKYEANGTLPIHLARIYFTWTEEGRRYEAFVGTGKDGPLTGIIIQRSRARYLEFSEVESIYGLLPLRLVKEYRMVGDVAERNRSKRAEAEQDADEQRNTAGKAD